MTKFLKSIIVLLVLVAMLFSVAMTVSLSAPICPMCGYSMEETYRRAAANGENGLVVFQCTRRDHHNRRCHGSIEQTIYYTRWGAWTVVQAPTCTQSGVEQRTSINPAGLTDSRHIPVLGHNFVRTTTPPTCTNPGRFIYRCSRCGTEGNSGITVPALGRNITRVEIEPSCGTPGSITYSCDRGCGYNRVYEIEPLDDHDWSEWVIEVEPAPGVDGKQVRICNICDYEEVEIIPMLEPIAAVSQEFGEWDGQGDVVAVVDINYEDFLKITLNGVIIDDRYFDIASGSTIITLFSGYVVGLNPGVHMFVAEFENNVSANIALIVPELPEEPAERGILDLLFSGVSILLLVVLAAILIPCVTMVRKEKAHFREYKRKLKRERVEALGHGFDDYDKLD